VEIIKQKVREYPMVKRKQILQQEPMQELYITLSWSYLSGTYTVEAVYSAHHLNVSAISIGRGYRASGCGHSKYLTTIADIFQDVLAYKSLQLHRNWDKAPHGIKRRLNKAGKITNVSVQDDLTFEEYERIGVFLGGKFELLDTGDNYEVYRWTDEEGGAKSDDRK